MSTVSWREGKNHLEFDVLGRLNISTELNRIYIAEFGNHRIHCLNLDLSLHSIIDDIYAAKDVKLTPEEIVVLSLRNPCVSIYSYSHQLIREIIPFGKTCQLRLPFGFNLDNCSNILITDFNSYCVCMYLIEVSFYTNSVKKEIRKEILSDQRYHNLSSKKDYGYFQQSQSSYTDFLITSLYLITVTISSMYTYSISLCYLYCYYYSVVSFSSVFAWDNLEDGRM